jgi:hypothetical protein
MTKACAMASARLGIERPSKRGRGTRSLIWCSIHKGRPEPASHGTHPGRCAAALRRLTRDAELLALEPGGEEYCERKVDDYLAGEKTFSTYGTSA